jgi:hypothetical protein
VTTALPITYDEPEPEKKSWFSAPPSSGGRKRLCLRKDITVIHTPTGSLVGKCGQNVVTPPAIRSHFTPLCVAGGQANPRGLPSPVADLIDAPY